MTMFWLIMFTGLSLVFAGVFLLGFLLFVFSAETIGYDWNLTFLSSRMKGAILTVAITTFLNTVLVRIVWTWTHAASSADAAVGLITLGAHILLFGIFAYRGKHARVMDIQEGRYFVPPRRK